MYAPELRKPKSECQDYLSDWSPEETIRRMRKGKVRGDRVPPGQVLNAQPVLNIQFLNLIGQKLLMRSFQYVIVSVVSVDPEGLWWTCHIT